MIERATSLLRAVLIAASCGALARSLHAPAFLLLALVALLAPFTTLRVGPRAAKVLALFAYAALAGAAVLSWSLMVVLLVHGEGTETALLVDGLALVLLAIPLSLSARTGLASVAAIFALVVAGLHRGAPTAPFVAAAAFTAIALAASESIAAAPRRAIGALGRRVAAGALAALVAVGIATGLPPAQIAIERTLFAMYTPPASARSGLSADDVRLGEVESLAMSPRVALHVWSPRAQKLRARVYLEFDGRLWHTPRAPAMPPSAPFELDELRSFRGTLHRFPGVQEVPRDALVTKVVPMGLDAGLIPTPGDALAIKTRDQVQVDPFGIVLPTRVGAEVSPYAIVHHIRSGVGDPGRSDPRALALPRVVDPRIRAAAARIAAETSAPRERIARTIAWIQSMAHYDLNVGAFRSRDPIAEFLFDKKRGYCEYFASALALMLRLEGVPARFATGYQADAASLEGSHYVVRDSDAHAWVEAYVEGVGWVEADATPAAEYALLHQRMKADAWSRVRAAWADFWLVVRHGSLFEVVSQSALPVLVVVLLSIALAIVRSALLRRSRKVRSAPATPVPETVPAIAACVARIDRAFEARGLPRPRAHGLLEHLALVERRGLAASEESALRRAIELVHRRHFGADDVDDASLLAATVAIDRGFPLRS